MKTAGLLPLFFLGLRVSLVTCASSTEDVVGPQQVQRHVRDRREDANFIIRFLAYSYEDDDNPYNDDSIYDGDDLRVSKFDAFYAEATAEGYAIYENPPSEWTDTEWVIASSIFCLSLTIMICCCLTCHRECCGSDGDRYDEGYKSFETYSTGGSSDNSTVESPRSRTRRQRRRNSGRSRQSTNSGNRNRNRSQSNDSGDGYDKIMELRSLN